MAEDPIIDVPTSDDTDPGDVTDFTGKAHFKVPTPTEDDDAVTKLFITYGRLGQNGPETADFSDVTLQSGWYRGYDSTDAPTAGTWYHLIHFRHNDLYARQYAYDFFSNNSYTRILNNGTWGDWIRMAEMDDLAAKVGATKVTTYNSGGDSGTHVLDANCLFVRIKIQGGGGAGAGTTATGSSEHSVGSGGAGGAYIEILIPVSYAPSSGIPYWVGSGASSSTGTGADGGESGITLTTGDIPCTGGDGGNSSNSTSSAGIATGGIGQIGDASNVPDGCLIVHMRGGSGGDGWWYAPDPAANPSIQKGGRGGSSGMGNANARETGGNGTGYSTGYNSSGLGPGTGGGGACSGRNHSAFDGGSGTDGAVQFEEYLAA